MPAGAHSVKKPSQHSLIIIITFAYIFSVSGGSAAALKTIKNMTIRIPDGNAFRIRLTARNLITGEYTEAADLSNIDNLVINYVRRGIRFPHAYTIDEEGRATVADAGTLDCGFYGIELTGYYGGEKFRFYGKDLFEITTDTTDVIDPSNLVDIEITVKLNASGVSKDYVDHAVNGMEASMETMQADLRDEIAEAGKVDDVKVNGVSVVSGKKANITVPTKVSDLTNDSGYQNEQQVQQKVDAAKITAVDISVDGGTGTPSGSAGVSGNKLVIALHNIKGQKGDPGESIVGPQGPQGESFQPIEDVSGLVLAHTTGQDNTKAMTQKAVTDVLNNIGQNCLVYDAKTTVSPSNITLGKYTPGQDGIPVSANTQVMGLIPCEGVSNIKISVGSAYKISVAQLSNEIQDGDFSTAQTLIESTGWEQSADIALDPSCLTVRILIKNNSSTSITVDKARGALSDIVFTLGYPTYSPAASQADFKPVEDIVIDGYIRNAVDQSSNVDIFGTAATMEWDDRELILTQTTAANGGISFRDFLAGGEYIVQFKAKASFDGQIIVLGDAASSGGNREVVTLTNGYKEYTVNIAPEITSVSIILWSNNVHIGETISLKDMVIYAKGGITKNKREPFITFNTDAFLQSVSRNDKYLVKIACEGDSLIANAIGGAIPSDVDEGDTMRPMRLLTNGVPRRLYDFLSWNKPTWRRLDHSDWTKSGFSAVTNWNNQTNGNANAVFHGTNEKYHKATTSGAYCEITVPDGFEHFAIICRTRSGNGSLGVTINGVAPSTLTYSNPILEGNPEKTASELTTLLLTNSVVTTDVCPINVPCGADAISLNKGTTACGNPYAIYEFNNLPEGDNVIRFTSASSAEVDVWGGFYWSGHTMVVMNIAHGGRTTSDLLTYYLPDELFAADYDAVLFEVTEMNNTRLAIDQTEDDILSIISKLEDKGIDHCFTSCNPLGLSIVHDTNFWTADSIVTDQFAINNKVREVMFALGQPFIDLFTYYKWRIENRGGSLEGGEGGLWYTWDGQHGNPSGVKIWVDCLKKVLSNKAIMQ